MLTLGIERFFLAKESHELDKSVASLLKNQTLEATPKDLREFKKKPNQTLAMLKGKSKMILQEINSIESAARVDGVSPLVQLSQLFKNNPDISLTSFIVNDGSVTTSWQAKEASMLMNIKTTLESTGFTNLNINMNQGNRELLATFNY
jgi:hypothetical protein